MYSSKILNEIVPCVQTDKPCQSFHFSQNFNCFTRSFVLGVTKNLVFFFFEIHAGKTRCYKVRIWFRNIVFAVHLRPIFHGHHIIVQLLFHTISEVFSGKIKLKRETVECKCKIVGSSREKSTVVNHAFLWCISLNMWPCPSPINDWSPVCSHSLWKEPGQISSAH